MPAVYTLFIEHENYIIQAQGVARWQSGTVTGEIPVICRDSYTGIQIVIYNSIYNCKVMRLLPKHDLKMMLKRFIITILQCREKFPALKRETEVK